MRNAQLLILAVALTAAHASGAAILYTWNFDAGAPTLQTLDTGSSVDGWSVTAGSVDWVSYWRHQGEGSGGSLDLSGTGPGTIQNTVALTAGVRYVLTFYYSGNPDAPAGAIIPEPYDSAGSPNPGLKTFRVAAGTTFDNFTFDIVGAGNTQNDMMWTIGQLYFTASGASELLSFQSTTIGPWGPALDSVSLAEAVPEPTAFVLFGSALLLLPFARRWVR